MDKNQAKGHAKEAKGEAKEAAGKVTGDKSTEYEGKAEKHGGKAGAVLGDINSDAKKGRSGYCRLPGSTVLMRPCIKRKGLVLANARLTSRAPFSFA